MKQTMETIPYTIKLMAPALVRVVDYDASEKRALISTVSIIRQMRQSLKTLINKHNLSEDFEVEIFGELRPDGYAKKSAFQISTAFSKNPLGIIDDQSKECIELPFGTVLNGIVRTEHSLNSSEGLSVLMALLCVRSLTVTNDSNHIPCIVSVNTSNIEFDNIYSSNNLIENKNIQSAALEWVPYIQKRIISFFADRPEDMFLLHPRKFENLVATLLENEGFEVKLTPETRDGGYDILAIRNRQITGNEVFLVECKRYAPENKINVSLIRNLIGVVHIENATKGILITTSKLTQPAKKLVESNSSKLMVHDYNTLKEWLTNTVAI